ncbi:MAG: 3'-5' exonuclease [Kiritimatiellaeota bacterium]|nr:3'-5' exonuclease [Kiritimatiellota bacterium]
MKPSYTEARAARFAVIDFETTGAVAGYPVEPWQVGMVRVESGAVSGARFESLIRVGERPFNPRAPGRHAQLRAQLAVAPTAGELLPVFSEWLIGVPLVAHNVGTERTTLAKVAPLHRFGPWVDTLALARHAYPQLTSKSLEDVIAALGLLPQVQGLCPGREAHDALYDAAACAVLLTHFLALPGWEHVTVEALAET